jgi:phage terminase large subunit-like protein
MDSTGVETATALPSPVLWPLPAWLVDVQDDPAYGWAIGAWTRAAAMPGAWFDARKADGVVANWPRWFRLTSDRFAGVPFRLTLWQEITVRLLVGWKRPADHIDPRSGNPVVYQVRVFSRLLLWVPRKNGKTEFLAALALLFFIYERLPGSEGYCFARDEDQAKIPFGRMKAMLMADPSLTGGATPRVTMTAKGIFVIETSSLFQLLSGKPDGKHGRMPQVILGDEMHEWETRDLEDNLRQGTGTRLQPVELYASTAGIKSKAVGYGLWEETLTIAAGQSDDLSTLAVVFAAAPEDEWQSEQVWKRANPTLGLTPTWDYLRKEAAKARGNPRAEAAFRRYHLNQWVENTVRWLPADKWKACAPDPEGWRVRAERLKGRRCYGAVDAAGNLDIAALVWLFEPETPGGPWELLPRFWVPEATLQRRAKADKATPWMKWHEAGAIETTPGEVTDQNYIRKAIRDGMADYAVQMLGFDPWNTMKLKTDLVADGVDIEMMRDIIQGHRSLGEPSREFERLVFAGLLDHGGHPVLGWMAGNVVVRFDENMNFVPARKRSADKIDGIAATVMAIALTMGGDEPAPVSPWEDPNFKMDR